MSGHVHATQTLKDQPQPRTADGAEFTVQHKTKDGSVRGGPGQRAVFVVPQPPKPANGPAPAMEPAAGAQPAPGASK